MFSLIQFLNAIHPLSEDVQQYLFRHLKQKRFRPGETWLKDGQVCMNICFIEEGLFKSVYTKRGRSYINWFMRETDVMIAVRSFLEQIPSRETIISLEPSLIYYIDFPTFQHLNTLYPAFQHITITLLSRYYERCQDRTELLRLFRNDRYSEFMRTEKELASRLKQKDIAAYLGLSEERLSELKSVLYS
jgi:CRP/FNR family transcriptional regulator, anaerobic regulatory protein